MLFPADCEEWDEAICSAYPLTKFFIENENTRIKLYSADKQPNFLSNGPYLEEGGILLKKRSITTLEEDISNLFEKYDLNYILLKSRDPIFSQIVSSQNIDNSYYTFLLDVSEGIECVWENKLKAKTRNQVRKAEKNNFNVRFGHRDLLDDFYNVVTRCWRDLGTPVHSYQFFKLLLDQFDDKVSIAILYDGDIPISTALLFMLDGTISHPFAGTINKYKPTSANNLLYWSIIKFACENGFNTFDMGRSRLGQGTFNFKKSWGGVAKNIYHYYFIKDDMTMPTFDTPYYKIATSMWKHVPMPLANWLGPKLIYKII